ncbi:helix-turn-helix domain-containing protein [Planctomycetales bacterium ZRK34]|nr:helix-turn-helix domain-containing protein [Planctomycetales bacterium ZRK34]
MTSDRQVILTLLQVAEICGVSRRTVLRWIHDHGLPVHRLPGAGTRPILAVRCSDLDDWLDQHRHDPSQLTEEAVLRLEGQRFLRQKNGA